MKSDAYYDAQGNYCLSKLLIIWVARHFDKEIKNKGINNVTVNVTHPGMVGSNFGKNTNKGCCVNLIYKIGSLFADSVEKGAESEVFLAISPKVEGVSGKYYSNKCVEDQPKEKYYSLENEEKIWNYCCKICKSYME